MQRFRWLDLYPHLPLISDIARQRDEQKCGYQSTKNWSVGQSTHFVGTCGEFGFWMETGLRVDTELKVSGDNGADFTFGGRTYNVKTATFWQSPDIKEFPDHKKSADVFILAALKDRSMLYFAGWATQEQVLAAPRRNYGRGDMLSISCHQLARWGQIGLPPWLPNREEKISA